MDLITKAEMQMLRCSIKRNDPTPRETREREAAEVQKVLASTTASDSHKRSARQTWDLIQERGWLQTADADRLQPSQ